MILIEYFFFFTGNGIYQEEQGVIKNADDPGYETQVQQGQYQYVSPEGKVIVVKYTADENGFQPVGDHIPTPPPIPKEIQKLLDLLATKKPDPADNYDYDNQDYDSAPITTPKPKPRGSSNRNKAKFDTLELDLPK